MPLISVIVPVYKVEKYIHRCVDSILAQTFNDFELILVDDGSPDNCGKICDEYAKKDSRIVVIHQENGGLSAARNAGLDWVFEYSDSQWISFVDSDDYVYPQYLEKLYQAVVENNTKISMCDFVSFSYKVPECSYNEKNNIIISGIEACYRIYELKSVARYIVSWGKMYAKELFINLRFPLGKIHEDQFTTYKLFWKCDIISVLDNCLYGYYYNHEGIMNSSFTIKRYDDIEALDGAILFFESKNENDIACEAKSLKKILISKYSICARDAKIYKQVPTKYQVGVSDAIKAIAESLGEDYCEYFISKYYPKTVRFYSIVRKVLRSLKIVK